MRTPQPFGRARSMTAVGVVRLLLILLALLVLATEARSVLPDSHDSSQLAPRHLQQDETFQIASHQCKRARKHAHEQEAGFISYLPLYYCASKAAQPFVITLLVVWLAILFTTIGTAASDYFTPNLNSIARILGLSESVAGVTFLAFGNGSPDIFSTFASMRTHSGGLAIGELIGAACFITSVVAGSMALIRPFSVPKYSFVRDVGFFLVASCFSLLFLSDGQLQTWECLFMIGLYAFYVVIVVFFHWTERKLQKRTFRETQSRNHFINAREDGSEEPIEDEGGAGAARHANSFHLAVHREDSPSRIEGDLDAVSVENGEHLNHRRHSHELLEPDMEPPRPIRPSLVGALEFRAISWSLVRSRSQSSVSSGSVHSRRLTSDSRTNSGGLEEAVSATSSPTRTRSLRAPSLGGPADGLLAPEDLVQRRRAHSAGNPSASNRIGPQLPGSRPHESPLSPEGLSPRPINIDVPSIILTEDERDGALQHEPEALASPQSPDARGFPAASPIPDDGASQLSTNTALLTPSMEPHGRKRREDQTNDQDRSRTLPDYTSRPTLGSRESTQNGGHGGETQIFPPYHDDPGSPTVETPLLGRLQPDGQGRRQSRPGDSIEPFSNPRWWPKRHLPPPMVIFLTLFPTFVYWRHKGFIERILAVVTAPSVFLLTITLPVVDVDDTHEYALQELYDDRLYHHQLRHAGIHRQESWPALEPYRDDPDAPPAKPNGIRHTQSDPTPMATPQLEIQDAVGRSNPIAAEPPQRRYWLTAVQLFTAPWFVALVLYFNLDDSRTILELLVYMAYATIFALAAIAICIIQVKRHKPWLPRPLLCSMGFVVSVMWISTIAGEVVGVLKAFGAVFGISDALLGLTIFAVGNSFGDLVANITIAKLGFPIMALSACFGGPLLNILLGVGLGGVYMRLRRGTGEPYAIHLDRTLVISGISLVCTLAALLVALPLNGWVMDRKLGLLLVGLWVTCTTVNIVIHFAAPASSTLI